ncbi:MAG: hypothetical protein ACLFP1_09425, partial [Candidatus Goldiibacteriota bacterium]
RLVLYMCGSSQNPYQKFGGLDVWRLGKTVLNTWEIGTLYVWFFPKPISEVWMLGCLEAWQNRIKNPGN